MTQATLNDPPSLARRALSGLDWLAAIIVILAIAGMVIIVATQVFLRYGLNSSLDWAEEISRLLFVWSVFLAIPLGLKRGVHVGIDLLTGLMPTLVRNMIFRLTSALAIALLAVVAWEAAILTRDQWDEPITTLDLSVGFFMLPLLIGAAHSILHLVLQLVEGPPPREALAE
jgi:TRAP-type C4-dicarboxylate transport system permease small subunit